MNNKFWNNDFWVLKSYYLTASPLVLLNRFIFNTKNRFISLLSSNTYFFWLPVFSAYNVKLFYSYGNSTKSTTTNLISWYSIFKLVFPKFLYAFSFKLFISFLLTSVYVGFYRCTSKLFYFSKLVRLQTFRDGFLYIRGLFIIFCIDACLTDDEPLWEPIEWSLVQTWLLFIFFFSWVGENLISSRYGAFTGRDKRVWFALYKWYWWFEIVWIASLFLAAVFVVVPFYYEINYSISNIVTWWDWYNRAFFFKFIFLYTVILLFSYTAQLGLRWLNWKKIFFLLFLVIIFLAYLMFTQFILLFFGYFTDTEWYNKSRWLDYSNLSHGSNKWNWGPASRDHFTYHRSSTVFWFKNDTPYAAVLIFVHLLFFFFLFFLFLTWVVLLRRIYTTKEMTYTSLTYAVSALRQFFYFFLFFYIFIVVSFINQFYRVPSDFFYFKYVSSWLSVLIDVITTYSQLIWLIVS